MFYIDDRQAAEAKFSESILSDDDFETNSKTCCLSCFLHILKYKMSLFFEIYFFLHYFFVVPFAKHAI